MTKRKITIKPRIDFGNGKRLFLKDRYYKVDINIAIKYIKKGWAYGRIIWKDGPFIYKTYTRDINKIKLYGK